MKNRIRSMYRSMKSKTRNKSDEKELEVQEWVK